MATYTQDNFPAILDVGDIVNFNYTGNYKTITLQPGIYNMKCYGAQGDNPTYGGKGAYTEGILTLENQEIFYIYVGQRGSGQTGGWNGGGNAPSKGTGGGGGATDIRLIAGVWNDISSLRSRVMVAAGGGGYCPGENDFVKPRPYYGGDGGLNGLNGQGDDPGVGATQINCANNTPAYGNGPSPGKFGYGGTPGYYSNEYLGAGGSGWYGGSGSGGASGNGAGGGGSSFVSGHPNCNAIKSDGTHTGQSIHFSGLFFTQTLITAGVNNSNGLVIITFQDPLPPRDVTLNKNLLTMYLDTTFKLVETITPNNARNKNVTWKSSNTFVAEVNNNGLVSAVNIGQAVITVTTEDGGLTAVCAVTVTLEYKEEILFPRETPLEIPWTKGEPQIKRPRKMPLEYVWIKQLRPPEAMITPDWGSVKDFKVLAKVDLKTPDTYRGKVEFEFTDKSITLPYEQYCEFNKTTYVWARCVCKEYRLYSQWIQVPIKINVAPPSKPIITRTPSGSDINVNTSLTASIKITAVSTDPNELPITYVWTGRPSETHSYGIGTYTVTVKAVNAAGVESETTSTTFTVRALAPTAPVITRVPNTNNIQTGTSVKITAVSTDPLGLPLTYIWTNRPAETYVYPLGRQLIQVYARNSAGLTSPTAATLFFMTSSSGGGMVLTGPDSYLYEDGFPGAYIIAFTFTVPPVSGHSGSDYFRVRAYNPVTAQWVQVLYKTTSNGGTVSGSLPDATYTRLEFYYYASHCMYGKSNITYSVEFTM